MNLLDRAIAWFSPRQALHRLSARRTLDVLARYEAAKPGRTRKLTRDNATGEVHVARDAATCRAMARHLERNHDIVRGALTTLTRNIVGANGISIEPQPRNAQDDIHDDFARELLNGWREFTARPEVTHTLDWVMCQELACRTWLRDGEMFAQFVEGTGPTIDHGKRLPLSLELLEADLCPLEYTRDTPVVEAGIERNAWGRPVAFYFYKQHPGGARAMLSDGSLKRVPSDRILHLAVRERISGLRGVSMLASAITRLEDIKDYEESERIAARIAAAIAAYVKRDVNMQWTPPEDFDPTADRKIKLGAGAIFDQLLPGEEIEMVDPKRPNTALAAFRESQLRAAAAGIGTSYSTLARDYNGTYSAQRQELVEQWEGYRMLTSILVAQFVRPVWERYVNIAVASGQVRVPADVRRDTITQAEFRGPAMPWINPTHEAQALRLMVRSGFRSAQQVIGERGGRLQDVYEQLARERRLAGELDLVLESDAAQTTTSGQPRESDPDQGDDAHRQPPQPPRRLNGADHEPGVH